METISIKGKIFAILCAVIGSVGITIITQVSYNTTYQEKVQLLVPMLLIITLAFTVYFWFLYESENKKVL